MGSPLSGNPALAPTGANLGAGEIGWRFYAQRPGGIEVEIHPTTTGDFSYDDSSDIRTTLSGLIFLPDQLVLFDMNRDVLRAQLIIDGLVYDFGRFYAASLSRQKDVMLTDLDAQSEEATSEDLVHIEFADGFIKLSASSEDPISIGKGGDPAQIILDLAKASGFSTAVANSEFLFAEPVVWDSFTPYISIINELVPVAGHRPPWVDQSGIFRSVSANVVDTEVIALEDLHPIMHSIVISEVYLTAPNRVVVYDDQSGYPLRGVWNAPASAPHSFANRGYYVTQASPQQGLQSVDAAERAAKALGEQLTARILDATIFPTQRIDGPTVISYDDTLWLVRSWGISTAPGSTMTIRATELIDGE